MTNYEYRVHPFVGILKKGEFSTENAKKIAQQLQDIMNKGAKGGWEFYRVDKVGVHVPPGCFAAMLGAKTVFIEFDEVVFRRIKS